MASCSVSTCLQHFPVHSIACWMATSSLHFNQHHGTIPGEFWRSVASVLFSITMSCTVQWSPMSCTYSGDVLPPAFAGSHIVITERPICTPPVLASLAFVRPLCRKQSDVMSSCIIFLHLQEPVRLRGDHSHFWAMSTERAAVFAQHCICTLNFLIALNACFPDAAATQRFAFCLSRYTLNV